MGYNSIIWSTITSQHSHNSEGRFFFSRMTKVDNTKKKKKNLHYYNLIPVSEDPQELSRVRGFERLCYFLTMHV